MVNSLVGVIEVRVSGSCRVKCTGWSCHIPVILLFDTSANPWWVARWERHGEEMEDAQKLTVDHERICQTSYIFTFLHRPLSVKQPKLIKLAFLFLLQLFVHCRASELIQYKYSYLNITRHNTALKINLPDLLQFDHKNICDVRCW